VESGEKEERNRERHEIHENRKNDGRNLEVGFEGWEWTKRGK
jgi:hypothetical protein